MSARQDTAAPARGPAAATGGRDLDVVLDGAPVGRGELWRAVSGLVLQRRSGLVVLAGTPGRGRTYVSRAVASAARSAGWNAIGDDESLPLHPTSSLRDVRRALTALVEPEARPHTSAPRLPRPPEGAAAVGTVVRAADGLLRRLNDEQAVFATLERAAPLLVAVDGYRPPFALHTWVVSRLLPRVRRSRGAVLVVVADTPERVERLVPVADQVHTLGELDPDEVRTHLARVTAGREPPLGEHELDAYTAASVDDPSTFMSLLSALAVAEQED